MILLSKTDLQAVVGTGTGSGTGSGRNFDEA